MTTDPTRPRRSACAGLGGERVEERHAAAPDVPEVAGLEREAMRQGSRREQTFADGSRAEHWIESTLDRSVGDAKPDGKTSLSPFYTSVMWFVAGL